jgi:hypothetical protein
MQKDKKDNRNGCLFLLQKGNGFLRVPGGHSGESLSRCSAPDDIQRLQTGHAVNFLRLIG